MPVVSQLSTALVPLVTVTLKGPGPIEGPTDRRQNKSKHSDHTTTLRYLQIIASLQPWQESTQVTSLLHHA